MHELPFSEEKPMLTVAYDADTVADPDPCGWVVPDLWRDEAAGKIRIRMCCSGCGAVGGWAIGPAGEITSLTKQATALGPHAPG